jgi:hypothetical protein
MFAHAVRLAFSFAAESAGRSIAAKMAMIAITTRSSINVKADSLAVFEALFERDSAPSPMIESV